MEGSNPLLVDGPARARWTIVLAHGAGAAMDSDFMQAMAERLAARRFRVVRFEFPYMETRRRTGRNKPPDREPVLRQAWHDVVARCKPARTLIGGKSMGGRIASMVADELQVAGLVCLGYPFHPVGKPDKLRVEHLRELKTPTLILQGERDTFGNRDEVKFYRLPRRIRVRYLADGDHSFKPRKASGKSLDDNLDVAATEIATFVGDTLAG